MANLVELRTITRQRLKTAKILITAGDWDGAAYMLGYVLECALKAVTCKTLHLVQYPENKSERIDSFFMTHRFDQLLIISGMSDVFNIKGPIESYRNWSEFTQEYPGDWPGMRYDQKYNSWGEAKVRRLYTNLTDKQGGILTEIIRRKRW